MANEKRRYVVGNKDDMKAIVGLGSDVILSTGHSDGDKMLVTVMLPKELFARRYVFHCFCGDILIEYDDGTWDAVYKDTEQSRAMAALCCAESWRPYVNV